MRKKIFYIILLIVLFVLFSIFLYPKNKEYYVKEVISPTEILLENGVIVKIGDLEGFDSSFSDKNKEMASKFGMSEEEAFVFGNLGKYWAKNILENRKIYFINNDFENYRFAYRIRLMHSPYCIKDGKFTNPKSAQRLINTVKSTKYVLLDVDTDEYFPLTQTNSLENFIVVRKGYVKQSNITKGLPNQAKETSLSFDNSKIILTDFTTKLKPDRNCSTQICQEILSGINSSKESLDIAIYGYSNVPMISEAIQNAQKRGVKIRLVYDIDSNGKNIYPNTFEFASGIQNSNNDKNSELVNSIMHNKFYIIDRKTVITGSANLSQTDMSGYNSNVLLIVNSVEVAKAYTKEFEQMYNGKFHTDKKSFNKIKNVYFSPQDKAVANGVLPLIRKAQKYIYLPIFIITEKRVVEELINAKNRGVDVKIIADGLNAPKKFSKVQELREAGIPVKVENYAGKLHSKSMIVDDKYLIIGSMNFSNSGENKNDENIIILENSEMARFYKQFFLELWNKIPEKWLKLYPKAEGLDSIGSCSDGIDNDYDGLIDSQEASCKS